MPFFCILRSESFFIFSILYDVINNEVEFILYITIEFFNILQAFNIFLIKAGVDAFANEVVHRHFKSVSVDFFSRVNRRHGFPLIA